MPRRRASSHATTGVEGALRTSGWLDRAASVTYTDSKIKENSGFVAVPGDTIGRWQPNLPRWRASVGARFSVRECRTLDNSDVNGFTCQGVSKCTTVDVRIVFRVDRNWTPQSASTT